MALDLLILKLLARESMHGYGLMQRLSELTGGVFEVTPGSLFPSLQRLEEAGCITGSWGTSENNRRARFYAISKKGQKQLATEEKHWGTIKAAITNVLENA
jgi:transcriptional regulator